MILVDNVFRRFWVKDSKKIAFWKTLAIKTPTIKIIEEVDENAKRNL